MEGSSPSTPDGSKDRIAPRYVFEGRIRIRVHRTPQNLDLDGWVRDMGESGLGAFVASELILGEDVSIEIALGPARKLTIPAKVVRCLGTQYGFQFTALSADQREDVRSAVKGRSEIPFGRNK